MRRILVSVSVRNALTNVRATETVGISSGFALIARRRRLASPWRAKKRSPEAAVPPTNALSPATAGSEMVWADQTARQAVAALHSRQSRRKKSPTTPCRSTAARPATRRPHSPSARAA